MLRTALLAALVVLAALPADAQSTGEEEAARRAAVLRALPADAAKRAFGTQTSAAPMAARAIGFYAKGCLAGARALPVDGATWQVMRTGRGRNWGHPRLIALLERLAARTPEVAGWPGLLVGDISQPRGGPMLTGHASHQVGLDADLWLTPMPDRRLSRGEREEMSATDMVRPDRLDVGPAWTPGHLALIREAARQPDVERIFVNPAIKRAICRDARGDRTWLGKVRPMWGHNYHFHVRLACPDGEEGCRDQAPPTGAEDCGAPLDAWFTPAMLHPKPGKPSPPMPLSALPEACRRVLVAE